MELPRLTNLTSTGIEGNPSIFSPDISSGEFNSILLNQMIKVEEGDCNDDGCGGAFPTPLLEESALPNLDEEESLPSDTSAPLFVFAFIEPANVSNLLEGQEFPFPIRSASNIPLLIDCETGNPDPRGGDLRGAPPPPEQVKYGNDPFIPIPLNGLERIVTDPSGSLSSDQLNLPFNAPFLSRSIEGKMIAPPGFQSGSEQISPDLSLLEKDISGTVQRLVEPGDGFQKETFSLFQSTGSKAGNSLMPSRIENDGQGVPTASSPPPVSLEKEISDLTLKFESIDRSQVSGSRSAPENGPHRWATGQMEGEGKRVLTSIDPSAVSLEESQTASTLKFESIDRLQVSGSSSAHEKDPGGWISLKHHSALSESYSVQNEAVGELKTELFLPGETSKAQNSSPPRVDSFEIYRQVGQKMVWSVRNGEEKVNLLLDPPQLGNLRMEITKEREIVKATLWAESPVAKELLETHRSELSRILETGGFKLERFNVFVQHGMKDFYDGGRNSMFNGEKSSDRFVENHDSPVEYSPENSTPPAILNLHGNRSIDLFV